MLASDVAANMQAEGHNSFPNVVAEPVTVPVATQFQGAHGFNISGNPILANIGVNTGKLTTVNNYGGTHGLENLKEFVSFAALHNSSEQDPERRCHPGTRENILSRLRHWIDNPNLTDRIFWLYGPAGAGKSAIAQTIAHGYKQGEVAATFFFYRSDPGRNDGNRLFTTIAWQLAFSIPAIKDFIVDALDKTPHLPRTNVETQFEQLVAHPTKNIISQMPQLAPVVIIDGVDECSDEPLQRRFLAVIGNAVKDCHVPLRFLICSRSEALIEETLDQFKDFTLRVDLAALEDANRDIEKYLMDKFSDIASKQHLNPSWPGQAIIEEIVFKSSGNFILASTLVRFIGDEDHSAVIQLDIVRKLKPHGTMSPFALLDELYLEILKRQPDQEFLKTFLALIIGRSSIEQGVFYNGAFHNSVFHGNVLHNSVFHNTAFHNSVFRGNTLHNSVFHNTAFHNSVFRGNTLHNSMFQNSMFHNTAFYDSVFHNSKFNDGSTFLDSVFHDRAFHNSKFHDNAFHNSAFHDRVFHNSKFHDNAFHNSAFHDRVFHNSKFHNSAFHNSALHDSAFHNSKFRDEVHNGDNNRFPDELHNGDSNGFPDELHNGDSNGFPDVLHNGDSNRFPDELHSGDSNRFPDELHSGDSNRFPDELHNGDSNGFPDELHNGDSNGFPDELHNGDDNEFHDEFHKDDAKLMNVSEEELYIKLRRMRSLLKFKPFIDVYHKSFLDFLQDSFRSGRYHISNQGGRKRYLELMVDSVVRHVSTVIEQPNCHETCRSSPEFKHIISKYPPAIDLSVEDWEEALKPLLDLQDKFLNTWKLLPCRITQAMRDLLLTLRILQSKAQPIAPAPVQVQRSNIKTTFTKWSRVLMTKGKIKAKKNNLDSCLSLLFSCLQKTNPVMLVDMAIIDCMSSLLAFDCSEIARGIRSVSEAQKLIDLVELLVNDRPFLKQCGPDATRKATQLVSEIFARVPLLPKSFLNGPLRLYNSNVELVCQTAFISKILNHNYMVSSFKICDESDVNESFDRWLQRSNPSFITRIRVMLEIARIIRYIHSMDIALLAIDSGVFVLDSNLRAKILFGGLFTRWGSETWIYGHEDTRSLHTCESNVFDFAVLLHSVCFDGDHANIPPNNVNGLVEDARKLIERCRAKDTKSRPTMEDVVKEMETWVLM